MAIDLEKLSEREKRIFEAGRAVGYAEGLHSTASEMQKYSSKLGAAAVQSRDNVGKILASAAEKKGTEVGRRVRGALSALSGKPLK